MASLAEKIRAEPIIDIRPIVEKYWLQKQEKTALQDN